MHPRPLGVLLSSLLASTGALHAAVVTGYVVKVDAQPGVERVYLDLGEGSGASVGQTFIVFTEGDELKHPVTHESLGRVENRIADGTIETVAPKYAVGRLSMVGDHLGAISSVAPGQRVRIEAPQSPTPPTAPPGSAAGGPAAAVGAVAGPVRAPRWRSMPVALEAVDMAVGDVDGDGKPDIVLADQTRVQAFPDDEQTVLKPSCVYENKDTGFKILSIDAADPEKTGRAKVFATFHNEFFNRIETLVLECKQGRFEKAAALPWATRAYQTVDGSWRLGGQTLATDRTFPFGNMADLQAKDGKYTLDGPHISFKRLEWIYGFLIAETPGEEKPFPLFLTHGDRIRAEFKRGNWSTSETYGQTSTRVRWYDNLINFRPRLAGLRNADGLTSVFALKNIPKLGGLTEAFGIFGDSELHRMHWTGMNLEEEWKAALGGYAADLALVPGDASRPAQVYAAVVSAGGKTAVLKFLQ